MTGDGPVNAVLVVLGVGPGEPESLAPEAADVLAAADVVFVPGVPAESTLFFYTEAWRVERITDLAGAVPVIEDWFRLNPGSTAVLAVPGDPADHPAFTAVTDGLRVAVPGLAVRTVPGVSIVPPRLSPLPW
jgi:precorrin-2 methylase